MNMENALMAQTSVMEQLEENTDRRVKLLEIDLSKRLFNAPFVRLYKLTTESGVIVHQ